MTREVQTIRVRAFLSDIVAVYRRYRLALAHEDHHGAFEVVPLTEPRIDWLLAAIDLSEEVER